MKPVECFHIGPQKAATTWVYRCLQGHPEIACPPKDSIHYFDIFYAKGREWYAQSFQEAESNQKLFDPTYTYIRSPWAPRRIYRENPRAKIVLCMRNPIDRAFSHYWHEKKKGKITFDFKEVLTNYDLFSSWVEPGFYAEHIERYLEYFPRDQILCLQFQTLRKDSEEFLRRLFFFFDVDSTYTPSVVQEKVNQAGERRTVANKIWKRIRPKLRYLGQNALINTVQGSSFLGPWIVDRYEYEGGVHPDLRQELQKICEPEIWRLETLLDIDLSHWRYDAQ